ncbi:ABC transporter ATPase [Mucilaginibacter robiniae]|uniref:ABC transporter ATPase n=1 Tax=Mucilaginibacter robiniae TaxID=2728022 RepID=A0A7L5DWT0_9SPHI|nr:ABC transporter ATPase [Mucilaginibacter robiniae]QJD95211.1 ABC transporter ATPase [Mucilaginibacter robiniae]
MQFSKNSRIWIYQSGCELTPAETSQIQQQLDSFTQDWTAHNHQLKATGIVHYNRFIILVVDESQADASGCSIDKSVRFLKELEQKYNTNLFDRFDMAYRDGDRILSASRAKFENLIKEGKITPDTIVFNNTIQTLSELENKWEVPFKESWHAQLFGSLMPA